MTASVRRSLTALAAAAGLAMVAPAAAHDHPPLDAREPEAWAMRYFASVFAQSGFGAPAETRWGALSLAVEVDTLPSLSEVDRTVGFGGTKQEALDRASWLARPRLTLGLPGQLEATLGWIPPIERSGVEGNVFTASLGRGFDLAPAFRLGFRLVGERVTVRGDITCTAGEARAGGDPVRNPFGCERASDDELTTRAYGAEATFAWRPRGAGGVEVYLEAARRRLEAEFQVDALYGGFRDLSHLEHRGWLWGWGAGVGVPLGERFRFALQGFYAPLEVERRFPPEVGRRDQSLLNLRSLVAVRFN